MDLIQTLCWLISHLRNLVLPVEHLLKIWPLSEIASESASPSPPLIYYNSSCLTTCPSLAAPNPTGIHVRRSTIAPTKATFPQTLLGFDDSMTWRPAPMQKWAQIRCKLWVAKDNPALIAHSKSRLRMTYPSIIVVLTADAS